MTGGYPLSSRVLSALLRVIIGLGGGLVVAALMAISGSVFGLIGGLIGSSAAKFRYYFPNF